MLGEIISALALLLTGGLVFWASKEANKIADQNRRLGVAKTKAELDIEIVKFREAWLQRLRKEMSIVGAVAKNFDQEADEMKQELDERILNMLLLMNNEDDNYKALSKAAYNLRDRARGKPTKPKDFKNRDYTRICQKILKSEWEKLKLEVQKAKDYAENQ